MKNVLRKIKSNKTLIKTSALVTTLASTFTANVALAVDDEVVAAAQTAGETSVAAAAAGLIAIIAVVVGISMVISLLKKA